MVTIVIGSVCLGCSADTSASTPSYRRHAATLAATLAVWLPCRRSSQRSPFPSPIQTLSRVVRVDPYQQPPVLVELAALEHNVLPQYPLAQDVPSRPCVRPSGGVFGADFGGVNAPQPAAETGGVPWKWMLSASMLSAS